MTRDAGETSTRSSTDQPLAVRRGMRLLRVTELVLILIVTVSRVATASGGGSPMPWDTPLQNLLGNLTGPTARALILIAIVACGLLWAFTRNEEGLKRLG